MKSRSSSQRDIAELTRAVEKMHGAKATFLGTDTVDERHQGEIIWKGTVSRFRLAGHPTALECFAWAEFQERKPTRYHAVLRTDKIDTAAKAVQASIVVAARNARSGN